MTGSMPVMDAHRAFSSASLVLKPVTSCSMPKTSVVLAFRPAGVRGTCAHACEKGAAASVAPLLVWVVAEADATTTKSAAAAPTTSQKRLCIDFPPFRRAGSRSSGRRRLLAPTPQGRSVTSYDDDAGA